MKKGIIENEILQEYANSYMELKKLLKNSSPDEVIAVFQSILKDNRTKNIKNEANNEPATEKQKKFLDGLGIQYPQSITKSEAFNLIKNHKNIITSNLNGDKANNNNLKAI